MFTVSMRSVLVGLYSTKSRLGGAGVQPAAIATPRAGGQAVSDADDTAKLTPGRRHSRHDLWVLLQDLHDAPNAVAPPTHRSSNSRHSTSRTSGGSAPPLQQVT